MNASTVRIDITPDINMPMGGNIRDDIISRGKHDSLFADILYLKDVSKRIVFIDLDWCEAPLYVIKKIKNTIVDNTDIAYSDILISMTHTHSAPDTAGYFLLDGMDLRSKEYICEISYKITDGVKKALLNSEPVKLGVGKTCLEGISFNRRIFYKDKLLHMNWEASEDENLCPDNVLKPEGPVDTDLYVIKICDESLRLKGVFINFTMHPAILVMKDWLFSKDFIYYLEKNLKEKYGDIFIYYSNGAEGNVNHINVYDKDQRRGWDEAERIGCTIAENVSYVIENTDVHKPMNFDFIFKKDYIPARKITEDQMKWAENLWEKCKGSICGQFDGVPDEWYAFDLLKMNEKKCESAEAEFHVIRIDDTLIVTVPGELFVELGLKIKKFSTFKNTIIIGLGNQSVGYIPAAESFKNGGYETRTCEFSCLSENAGNIIVDKVLQMIYELKGC